MGRNHTLSLKQHNMLVKRKIDEKEMNWGKTTVMSQLILGVQL